MGSVRLSAAQASQETITPMYDNSNKDWVGSLVVAAIGAGVVTSFAVSQGQSPIEGLGITAIAAVAAVVVDCLL